MKLSQKDGILTAIVGSYPKPNYIYPHTGRKLLDSFGFSFDAYSDRFSSQKLNKLLDKAALQAINDQDEANINLVSDGEERRGHYVLSIVKKLNGIDAQNLKHISIRGGVSERDVPRVVNKISYNGPILLDEYRFIKQHAEHTPKISLPGPTTVADCLANDYYKGDTEQLAFDYADAIREEVKTLIVNGCRIIQLDDPVLLRYPEAAKNWGLKALERCFAGLEDEATFIVHICRGYPDKGLEKKGIEYKANKNYYQDVLSWLSASKLDIVSIEGAQSNLDLAVLSSIGNKTIMLGVLDVGDNQVESIEDLVERGKDALRYLPKEQLILAPDCGMIGLSRSVAKQKLHNLAAAAQVLNQ